jgi:hypothetical protein
MQRLCKAAACARCKVRREKAWLQQPSANGWANQLWAVKFELLGRHNMLYLQGLHVPSSTDIHYNSQYCNVL